MVKQWGDVGKRGSGSDIYILFRHRKRAIPLFYLTGQSRRQVFVILHAIKMALEYLHKG